MKSFDLKLYKGLLYEIFFLIALGGGVRAMNAGLACPDWPLCFGQIVPDYHPEVYFEFIHRVLAGIVGIASGYLNVKIIRSPVFRLRIKFLAVLASFLLLSQILMGGLTVLLLLKESVVTMHLGLGTAFFAVTLWLYFEVTEAIRNPVSQTENVEPKFVIAAKNIFKKWPRNKTRLFAWASIVTIYIQILLGGLVASHYAATSCPGFPKCNGQWIPTLKGPVGLHVMHRLWAYILTIVLLSFVFYAYKRREKMRGLWHWARWFLPVIIFQICIGILNVHYAAPPLITVTHLALGTLLLAIGTRSLWESRIEWVGTTKN